ncbi:MAG TPA: FtsX-like permease family protein [Gaiellaceae bacterium]|nr:FtsX-like permease family protein [Gaiellaceae bacterium]
MLSASLRKSVTDLSRRRARTAFTVATLALAVASISFLAVPTLIDRAMQDEARTGRLADVTLSLRPLELSGEQLAAVGAVPNVAAVEATSVVDTRVLVGERRAPARVIGVRDFARQEVDVVRLESGTPPGTGEVVTDVQDANVGVYDGRAGDVLALVDPAGGAGASLRVTGEARSLPGGEDVQDENLIVLYSTTATVAALSGEPGYSRLALRLDDPSPEAAAATVAAVRDHLAGVPGFAGFTNLPEVRPPGDWPGKEDTEQFSRLLGVITVVALLTAIVLVSNTTTTLVAEQIGEIGIMRAIGARRRQIAAVYLRTTLLLGALGAVAGAVLGLALANLLARFFAMTFWAVDFPLAVDGPILALSLLVGLLAPPLAALPAIRRGLRVDLRAALESRGSAAGGGQDAGDRLLRRATFLPRSLQIGLRGVGRRKRRSLATVLIVALAVGNMLAFLALAAAATDATRAAWGDHLEDVRIWTGGRELFDERAEGTVRATPGVAEVEPALVNDVELAGEEAVVWGMEREPLFRYRLDDGRWFDAAEEEAAEPVAVIERNLARATGTEVGDEVTLATAGGDAAFRIVGVAANQQENGTALFVPLTTVREALGRPTEASTYWIRTTSSEEAVVDRTTALLEDRLTALGYEVGTEITYVAERENVAANRTVTTSITLLGLLIVAMSMVGLANAITMGIIERTREIGILRCIGARARDIRRIFASEGVVLGLLGWLLGIPLGYALTRLLVRLVREVVEVELPVVFPPWNVAIALAGTLVLALLIMVLPIRRAVRFRPGDALRYS